MGIVRFVLWSSICVGLGIFAASYEVAGHTPVDHLTGLWKQHSRTVGDVADDLKRKVTTAGPREQHSEDDREAVNRIIAKRTQR